MSGYAGRDAPAADPPGERAGGGRDVTFVDVSGATWRVPPGGEQRLRVHEYIRSSGANILNTHGLGTYFIRQKGGTPVAPHVRLHALAGETLVVVGLHPRGVPHNTRAMNLAFKAHLSRWCAKGDPQLVECVRKAVSAPAIIASIRLPVEQNATIQGINGGTIPLQYRLRAEDALRLSEEYTFSQDGVVVMPDHPHVLAALPGRCEGVPTGFIYQFSRFVKDAAVVLRTHIDAGRSILLIGPHTSGKTTALRDAAAYAATVGATWVVDVCGEICGKPCSDPPDPSHPCSMLADALQCLVDSDAAKPAALNSLVAYHRPDYVVMDNVRASDVAAVRTATDAGVPIICALAAPSLASAVGSATTAPLFEQPNRTGSGGAYIAAPAFDVVVEMPSVFSWSVITDVADAVATIHAGASYEGFKVPDVGADTPPA